MPLEQTELFTATQHGGQYLGERTLVRHGCAYLAHRPESQRPEPQVVEQPRLKKQEVACQGAKEQPENPGGFAALREASSSGRGKNLHSMLAHERHRGEFSARARLILEDLQKNGPGTAREIKERMKFADMNAVRPRLTEMVKAVPPLVVEKGSKQDVETGVPVTVYAAAE